MDAEESITYSWQWLLRNLSVSCRLNQFLFCNYSYIFFFINWTVRMSDNIPERVQILGHAHIICITVDLRENGIIWCQIFCDLLLKSAFERIVNVMQLILTKIKWHIKWKYLIQNSTIFAFHITLNVVIQRTVIII